MKTYRICIVVLVLCLGLLLNVGNSEVIQDAPDWLEGTLCVSAIGVDQIDDAMEYLHQYICFFDFSQREIQLVEVPLHSLLTKSAFRKGSPAIIYPMLSTGFAPMSPMPGWWLPSIQSYTIATEVIESENLRKFPYSTQASYRFDAPFKLLGVDLLDHMWPGPVFYMFCYGVSPEGVLEIQLVKQNSNNENYICHSFPLDKRFDGFDYAISENGILAWYDSAEDQIRITDGLTEQSIPMPVDQSYSGLCWLDEDRLLFFERVDQSDAWTTMGDMRLRVFYLDTGLVEPFHDQYGEEFSLNFRILHQTAVDDEGRYLACYYWNEENRLYEITVFSLDTGEQYTLPLWKEQFSNMTPINRTNNYTKINDIYILEPDGYFSPNVVWE